MTLQKKWPQNLGLIVICAAFGIFLSFNEVRWNCKRGVDYNENIVEPLAQLSLTHHPSKYKEDVHIKTLLCPGTKVVEWIDCL